MGLNVLGEELKNMRERKFPGLSLRRVGGILSDEHGFGEYFYTQLSKIEQGALVPSIDMLSKILVAYGATVEEKESMKHHWLAATWGAAAAEVSVKRPEDAARLLFRKVQKKKGK